MPGLTKNRAAAPEETFGDTSMEDAPTSAQISRGRAQNIGDTMQKDNGEEDEGEEGDEEEEEEEEAEVQRVRILPGSSSTAASFEFLDENHTLGNALRYIIMKNPDVEFCAYSIPHPSEPKMNIRIQTYETTTATAALAKGLQDLEDLCDVVADKFWESRNEFVEAEKEVERMET